MPEARRFAIEFVTSASGDGAKKTLSEFDAVKQQTLEIARANGLNEQQVKQVATAYDGLAKTYAQLEQQAANGTITNEEAARRLAQAQESATRNIRELNGELPKAAQGLRITNERAVMLGNGMAGLVTQFALGADGSQLLASGLTNVAMIMSTAGPWGAAAGFMLQTVTALTLRWKQLDEQATKAAEAQVAKMQQAVVEINNAKAAQDGYEQSVRSTIDAINQQSDALERRLKAEAEQRSRDEKLKPLDEEIAKQEEAQAIKDGTMTEEEARDRKIATEDMKMYDEQQTRLAEIEAQEEAARQKKTAANEEFAARQKEVRDLETRYEAAKHAKTAEAQKAQAKADLENTQTYIEGAIATFGEDSPEVAKLRAEEKMHGQRVLDAQDQLDVLSQFGPFTRDAKTGQIDTFAQGAIADSKKEELAKDLPAFNKRDLDANAAIAKAAEDRDAVNQEFEKRRTIYRTNLASDEERARYDDLQQPYNSYVLAGQARQQDREREGQIRREQREAAQARVGDGTEGLSGSLSELANAADKGAAAKGEIMRAIEALKDGADGGDLRAVAQVIITAGATQDANTKALVAMMRRQLDMVKQAQREITQLQAQMGATN